MDGGKVPVTIGKKTLTDYRLRILHFSSLTLGIKKVVFYV